MGNKKKAKRKDTKQEDNIYGGPFCKFVWNL
jgi:hypothetical protein